MHRTTWLIVTALLAALSVMVVRGECPNGCSGNGDCMAKDMCNCYKNFQGNDCADRTCLFGRAHVDTPKGDINMDKDRLSPGWLLANSQQDPAQTYEYFNPDAVADEAHFYMECSNKGICDRTSGLCQCFDGYEGNGCQRTTCPGKCNGHGTCESARELATKNAGTLFGHEGAAGAVSYDLWDSNSTFGCRCDPWFFGPDCNKRNCKVGVDPLYLSMGSANYETFVIHAYAATAAELTTAWIRLRVYDYFGESYITKKITILNDADAAGPTATANNLANAKAVAAAINAVPNLTFGKIKCEPMGVGSDLAGYKSLRPAANFGLVVTCQYNGNPGRMRLPDIAAKAGVTTAVVVTTAQQGKDTDWFTVKTKLLVDSLDTDPTTGTAKIVTLVAGSDDPTAALFLVNTFRLAKVGPHIVLVKTSSTTTLTLVFPLWHTIASKSPVFVTDTLAMVTVTESTVIAAAPVGSDVITFPAATVLGWNPGDMIFYQNAFFYVQNVWTDATAANVVKVKVDKPLGGDTKTGADGVVTDKIYKVTLVDKAKPFRYVSECSGRGMCGYDTGICTCFKGYTNDNCDTQNILAL